MDESGRPVPMEQNPVRKRRADTCRIVGLPEPGRTQRRRFRRSDQVPDFSYGPPPVAIFSETNMQTRR